MQSTKDQPVERIAGENDLPWRAWGSWFSWGSPVGLGIFIVCLSIAFYLVRVAG